MHLLKFRICRIFIKSKKLVKLEEIRLESGEATKNPLHWVTALSDHYSCNWGCRRYQLRADILDRILKIHGATPQISLDQLEAFVLQTRRKARLDHYEVSVAVLHLWFAARPLSFINTIGGLMAISHQMSFSIFFAACLAMRVRYRPSLKLHYGVGG